MGGSTAGPRQHLKNEHSEFNKQLKVEDEKRQSVKWSQSSVDVLTNSQTTVMEFIQSKWMLSAQKEERLTKLILAIILKQNLLFLFV